MLYTVDNLRNKDASLYMVCKKTSIAIQKTWNSILNKSKTDKEGTCQRLELHCTGKNNKKYFKMKVTPTRLAFVDIAGAERVP